MAFETLRKERQGPEKKQHQVQNDLADARAFAHGKETVAGLDRKDAQLNFKEIWSDPDKREVFRNIGFNKFDQKKFIPLFTKLEDGSDLNPAERTLREEVRLEFNYRNAIVKRCEKMLTLVVFKGARQNNHAFDIAAGALGPQRALELIKPRLLKLAGEETGDETLIELKQSLEEMNKIYRSRKYQRVMSETEKVMKKYDLKPEEYRDMTQGTFWENAAAVRRELNKDLGIVGRMKHGFDNWIIGLEVAAAGAKAERSSVLRRLEAERGNALNIVNKVLGEDFFKAIDQEAYGKRPANEILAEQETEERRMANEITLANETQKCHQAWTKFTTDPSTIWRDAAGNEIDYASVPELDRKDAYNHWKTTIYKKDRLAEYKAKPGWQYRMFGKLADIRLKQVAEPSFA